MITPRDKELVQRLTDNYLRMLKDSSHLFDGYVEEDNKKVVFKTASESICK